MIRSIGWERESVRSYTDRSSKMGLPPAPDCKGTAGDKDAIDILRRAAGHLAELVNRTDINLIKKSLPVKFTGGISRSALLYRELEKILPLRVTVSTVDIAQRAAELAR